MTIATGGNLSHMKPADIFMANLAPFVTVTDRVDEIFKLPASAVLNDLTWQAPTGDTSMEWRDYTDSYMETGWRQYIGEESLNRPHVSRKRLDIRMQPMQWVIGPYEMSLQRLHKRWERDPEAIAREMTEAAEAQADAVEELWNQQFVEMLVTDNGGHGGVTPLSRFALFSATHTSLRRQGTFTNIITPEVGDVGSPTIRDAHIVMEAALEHFMTMDYSGRRTYFQNREQARRGMVVVTTSVKWDNAFGELVSRPNLATTSTSAASEASVYGNNWQNAFTPHFLQGQQGKDWENWIRIFYVGSRPDDRPIRYELDLGVQRFEEVTSRTGTVGNTWSYYLDGWKPETGILAKPTV